MAENIHANLVAQKNLLHATTSWKWLVEAQIDGSEALRIAASNQDVVYGGYTYTAYPVRLGAQRREQDGSLDEIELVVSNFGQQITGYLEAGKLQGKKVTLRLVNTGDLSRTIHESHYTIRGAAAALDAVTFSLGVYDLGTAPFPAQRFVRTRCRHTYGQEGCWYDLTLPNLISGTYPNFDPATCDLTLNGGNGCVAKGANEAANGQPAIHPQVYGGFPGIPKGPGRI